MLSPHVVDAVAEPSASPSGRVSLRPINFRSVAALRLDSSIVRVDVAPGGTVDGSKCIEETFGGPMTASDAFPEAPFGPLTVLPPPSSYVQPTGPVPVA